MKKSFRKAMSLCVSLIMLFSILIPAGTVFAADAPKVVLSIVDENGEIVPVLNRYDKAYLRVEVSGISSVSLVKVKINNSNPEAAKFSTEFSEYKLRYQDVAQMKASNGNYILNIDNTDGIFGGVTLLNNAVTLTLANNMSTAEPPSERPPVAVSEFVMCDIPFEVIGDENSEVNFTFDADTTRVQLTDSVNSIYKIGAVKNLQTEPTNFKVAHNNPVITEIKFVDKVTGADATIDDLSIRAAIEKYSRGEAVDINWDDYKVVASVYDKTQAENNRNYPVNYFYSSDGSEGTFTVEGWKSFAEGGKVDEVQNVTIKVIDNTKANNPTMSVQAKITPAEPANYIRLKENTVISVKSGTSEENAKKAVKEKAGLFEQVYTDGTTRGIDVKVTDLTITDYFSNIYGTYNVESYETDAAGYDYDSDCTYTIKVDVDGSTGSGIQSGTVIGGGGGGAGGGGTTPPAENEPKDPATPVDPTTPVTPVEPVTPGVAPDMAADHWAAEAVKTLIDKGIVSGDTNGNIRPNDNITREEVAKIVAVAQGLTIEGDASNVTDGALVSDWAKPYVSAVVKAGAFSGNTDGSFAPKVAITREQFAAVIIRAYGFGESTDELKFTDAGELTWSKGLVAKAVELGIVNGYEDNSFRPGAQITRAEAFTMLTRAMNLKAALEEAAGIAPTE